MCGVYVLGVVMWCTHGVCHVCLTCGCGYMVWCVFVCVMCVYVCVNLVWYACVVRVCGVYVLGVVVWCVCCVCAVCVICVVCECSVCLWCVSVVCVGVCVVGVQCVV